MQLAVTATRRGLTKAQETTVERLIAKWGPEICFNGACEGGDRDIHQLITHYVPECQFEFYPCNPFQLRWAQSVLRPTMDSVYPVQPPLTRNRIMVDRGTHTLACPAGTGERKIGSGTWATMRYARKTKPTHFTIVWPDGATGVNWPRRP